MFHEFAVPAEAPGRHAGWRSMVCRAVAAASGHRWASRAGAAERAARRAAAARSRRPRAARPARRPGGSRRAVDADRVPRARRPVAVPPPADGERVLFVADLTHPWAARIARGRTAGRLRGGRRGRRRGAGRRHPPAGRSDVPRLGAAGPGDRARAADPVPVPDRAAGRPTGDRRPRRPSRPVRRPGRRGPRGRARMARSRGPSRRRVGGTLAGRGHRGRAWPSKGAAGSRHRPFAAAGRGSRRTAAGRRHAGARDRRRCRGTSGWPPPRGTACASWPTGGSPGSTARSPRRSAPRWRPARDGPTYALMGDLTVLHDITGLVIGPHEPRPDLVIVVSNNDGGAIFGTLEPGRPEYAGAFERVFGTPHGVTLAGMVEGAGAEHVFVSTSDELADALADPGRHPGRRGAHQPHRSGWHAAGDAGRGGAGRLLTRRSVVGTPPARRPPRHARSASSAPATQPAGTPPGPAGTSRHRLAHDEEHAPATGGRFVHCLQQESDLRVPPDQDRTQDLSHAVSIRSRSTR